MTRPWLAGFALSCLVSSAVLAGQAQTAAGVDLRLTASALPAKAAATGDTFRACARTLAAKTTTHLRPIHSIGASNARDPDVGPIPYGAVRVEHATNLQLTDGQVSAGNGFDTATGGGGPVPVSHGPVIAPVSLVVLDSKSAGRRVAFVEVQVKATAPVRWQLSNTLSIITDGGDGGFSRGTAPVVDTHLDSIINAYVKAFYPHGDDYSGNVCVLRLAPTGTADAVMFSTGYGDGYYPTFVGKDRTGAVASIVSYGYVLPWRDAGLPGTPPKYNFGL